MHLNPYQDREPNTVQIRERFGRTVTYKIPTELTVEELERLLEINIQIEKLAKQKVENTDYDAQAEAIKRYWDHLFAQCTIIFRHYHPEVTTEYLKKHLTQQIAWDIVNFFDINRWYKVTGSKKKDNPTAQLKNLRRVIIQLVRKGFSLYDLKKLYIDEFFFYYYEMIYTMETAKELKEGSYDKIRGVDNSAQRMRQFFSKL